MITTQGSLSRSLLLLAGQDRWTVLLDKLTTAALSLQYGSAHSSQRPSQRPFEVSPTHLYALLCSEAELTRTVRRCSSIEELEKIDGLPEETVNTLLDFASALTLTAYLRSEKAGLQHNSEELRRVWTGPD